MSSSGSGTGEGSTRGVRLPHAGTGTDGGPEQPQDLPVLDLSVLRELEEDMGGSGVAHTFANDYIGIWDKRLGYLEQSVRNNDLDLAMDAVLSLKNSAFMVGGSRLASLALEVERLIRAGNLSGVTALLPLVAQTGRDTVAELKKSYLRLAS